MHRLASRITPSLTLILLAVMAACGGGSSAPVPPPPAVSVSVTPSSATIMEGTTQQFTATVSNATNTGVTWSVDNIAGGNDFVGSVTSGGLYTAPTSTGNHTVTATSQQDTTKSASATVKVTVSANITVTVSPATASLTVLGTKQFKAIVQGSSNTAVTWQVNGIAGGNSGVGTIDAKGNYTAPATIPNPATVTVTAVSAGDATKSGNAAVTVVAAGQVSVTVAPATSALGQGGWEQFDATVTGSSNTGVTWQVNGIAGGNTTVGTIDSTGLYIAPVTPPAGSITVEAVAMADASKSDTAAVTVTATDPLGSVINAGTVKCPASKANPAISGTCYKVTVTGCPGVADQDAWVKVTTPSGTPKGTVLLLTGIGSEDLYEDNFTNGATVVNNLVNGGFTAAQMTWASPFAAGPPAGWLTGPGGVRRLACRVSTFATWIKSNTSIHSGGTGEAFCATGNSGGSGAISYGLAHYGMDSIFDMVEPTSGPPFGRIDYGCVCNQPNVNVSVGSCSFNNVDQCYGKTTSAGILDPAYGQPMCSDAVAAKPNSTLGPLFLADSVDAPGANYTYPKTDVHFVYGGKDNSQAVPLGLYYANQVIAVSAPAKQACVADAPHPIPNVADGATQISNDLINFCKKQ